MSTGDHFRKHTFSWHDAVTHFLIDPTVTVTFLSDLGQFQHCITNAKSCPHRKGSQVETFHDQILAKGTKSYFGPLCPKFLYLFIGQEADLTMPVSSMSITFDPPSFHNIRLFDLLFLCSTMRTDTDSHDPSFHVNLRSEPFSYAP